jgi:cytochrome c oxidase cbb3-type subunit 3
VDLRAVKRAMLVILVAAAACSTRPSPPQTSEGKPAADGVVNPLAGNRDAAAAGEKLFSSMNCDGCHGGGALGFVGPNLVDGRWRYGGSDSAVYQSILRGRAQGMPAYGGMLDASTIWQLVTYLKSQTIPVDIATEGWPEQP